MFGGSDEHVNVREVFLPVRVLILAVGCGKKVHVQDLLLL
jgi:hypothetical protein